MMGNCHVRFLGEGDGATQAPLPDKSHLRYNSLGFKQYGNSFSARLRGDEVVVISEQASSLNEKRKGMKKLLALIKEQAIQVVLIEYPDRLVRFGFGYLEEAFSWQGVRLEVLDPPKQLEPTEELVQDLLMIVTVFAGRRYGSRAKGVRERVKAALKEVEEGPDGAS